MMKVMQYAVVGLLISLSSSYIIMTINVMNIPDATMTGKELLEQVIVAAILGVAIGLASLIFETERLLFQVQIVIHFVAVLFFVFTAGYFGNWFDVMSLFSIFISVAVIYAISWMISLLLMKRDIDEMNRRIQRRRKKQ